MNDRDIIEAAQRLLRFTFKKEFADAAVEWGKETSRIRQEFEANKVEFSYSDVVAAAKIPDPFDGKRMPETPINDMGHNFANPRDNLVEWRYAEPAYKGDIDKQYASTVKKMNDLIGKEFATSEIAGLRQTLTDTWGEQVNVSLPFNTGNEQYYGTQHAQVVLEASPKGFVVTGYSYDKSSFQPSIER